MARGHALSQGRNYITIADISLVIRVVLSTASTERVRVFQTLLNFGGALTTSQISDYLDFARPTDRLVSLYKYGGLLTYSRHQDYPYYEYLEYLSEHRIEIDSVQNAVGYQKLWRFILRRLEQRFPERNYNRAIKIPETKDVLPDFFIDLQKLLLNKLRPERYDLAWEVYSSLEEYKGIKDNINDDEISLLKYFKAELSNSNNLTDTFHPIKNLIKELREQDIKSFMESTF